MEKGYLEIARDALNGVSHMYKVGSPNEFSASAQKVAERYMKAVVQKYPDKDTSISVMRTHSLQVLYNNMKHLNYIGIDRDKIRNLNGYYFEASYPGDNYVDVTEEEEALCYEAMIHISEKVEEFMKSHNELTQEFN